MSKQLVDLTGQRFGRWTILEYLGQSKWKAVCDCGNYGTPASDALTMGRSTSCGCLKAERSSLPEGVAAFNRIRDGYKRGAVKRGYSWELTDNEFRERILGDCYYCGASPSNDDGYKGNGKLIYNGVDRLVNSIGYVQGNVVSCCTRCNMAKGKMSEKDFISLVNDIHRHINE